MQQSSGTLPEGWTENVDPGSGNKFYYCATTGETTWTRPAVHTADSATGLPDGWTEHQDPSSGKQFYCNAATGETTWTRPVASTTASPLPTGWTEHDDASSGLKFYCCAATGETTWTRPASQTEGVIQPGVSNVSPLPAGWTEHDDTSSGNKFYCHTTSGRTSWTRPAAETQATDAVNTALPDGWTEHADPTSGKCFFYCAATGETTWTRPVPDSGAKGKGSAKGQPPMPKSAKGSEKGQSTSWRDKQAAKDPWTPVLSIGDNVMTKLPLEETDDFRRLFHARVGERLGQYVEKEGTVAGWDMTHNMWTLRMLDGSSWFVKAYHLNVRDPKSRQWHAAEDPPADARPAAPQFPQAKQFQYSAIIDSIVAEHTAALSNTWVRQAE